MPSLEFIRNHRNILFIIRWMIYKEKEISNIFRIFCIGEKALQIIQKKKKNIIVKELLEMQSEGKPQNLKACVVLEYPRHYVVKIAARMH